MNSSSLKNDGLAMFKRKFGGNTYPYFGGQIQLPLSLAAQLLDFSTRCIRKIKHVTN